MKRQKKTVGLKENKRNHLFSDKAYSLLRKMILNLKIVPREPLSELKLATMLRMSRTPVREALKKLKTEGLITSYGNVGYVLSIPTMKEIKDLYEVRTFLEGAAVRLAAGNIDLDRLEYFEEQFTYLKNRINRKVEKKDMAEKGGHDFEHLNREGDLVRLGKEFHLFIIQGSGNDKLKELIENINSQLEVGRIYSYMKRRKEAVEEHLKIISALKERNGEKSRAYMEEHLKNAFETLTKII